jgi:hypothetical protein
MVDVASSLSHPNVEVARAAAGAMRVGCTLQAVAAAPFVRRAVDMLGLMLAPDARLVGATALGALGNACAHTPLVAARLAGAVDGRVLSLALQSSTLLSLVYCCFKASLLPL